MRGGTHEMKRELTDAFLRALRPPAQGRVEVHDTRMPGLVFRITPAGSKTWVYRGRTRDGRATRIKLGDYGSDKGKLTLAAAREEAGIKKADLKRGADPIGERRAAQVKRIADKAAAREAQEKVTFGTVAARLSEWQISCISRPIHPDRRRGPWSPRYAAEVERVCRQAILPRLGDKVLHETSRQDWTETITAWKSRLIRAHKGELRKKPGSGAPMTDGAGSTAFLYRTISAFLNYAEVQGWVAVPLLPRKGAGIIAPPPVPRQRVLTHEELKAVWKAADREPPKLRAFVRLLILTGAREGEVADIAAGEVDLKAGNWTIPGTRTKNGRGYKVPLGVLAAAELLAVWPTDTPQPAHKLLGRSPGTGFNGVGRLKRRLDQATGTSGWRWHDLRRTCRTGLSRLGIPTDHAEAAINHVSHRPSLERTYNLHDYADEAIAALSCWQAFVSDLIGEETTAKPDAA